MPTAPASVESKPEPTSTPERRNARKGKIQTATYVDNVELPASLTFAPDGRMFFVEVFAGRVRVVENGVLKPEPVATFQVQQGSESGLLGIALDPQFTTNRYIYAYYSEPDPAQLDRGVRNRVIRFVERDGKASDVVPILDNLPNNPVAGAQDAHQGGALIFGPDGKLYVTVGDTGRPDLAQDPSSPVGKILRINPDGSIPADNPFPGSPTYVMGLRNPWGLTVHPRTGAIYASDNGNHIHDKVVLVSPGANYGWPIVEDPGADERFSRPVWDSGDAPDAHNGMTGVAVYSGEMFPDFKDSLFFCAFRTGKLRRAPLVGPAQDATDEYERLDPECRLGLTVGPDGAIYVSTMNKIVRLFA
jgi:glucose/arabinose dehydrogenase